jgi:hypothetical protein
MSWLRHCSDEGLRHLAGSAMTNMGNWPVRPTTASKFPVRRRRPDVASARRLATMSCEIVDWRATVDEDGHYSFAIAL